MTGIGIIGTLIIDALIGWTGQLVVAIAGACVLISAVRARSASEADPVCKGGTCFTPAPVLKLQTDNDGLRLKLS